LTGGRCSGVDLVLKLLGRKLGRIKTNAFEYSFFEFYETNSNFRICTNWNLFNIRIPNTNSNFFEYEFEFFRIRIRIFSNTNSIFFETDIRKVNEKSKLKQGCHLAFQHITRLFSRLFFVYSFIFKML
jgi:hypothetical protein